MKYKIGDKVKYDGGEWWLYGTVSAVFEHSICPFYRVDVSRMEKKSCKFSITQLEYELEAEPGDVLADKTVKDEITTSEETLVKNETRKRGPKAKVKQPASETTVEITGEEVAEVVPEVKKKKGGRPRKEKTEDSAVVKKQSKKKEESTENTKPKFGEAWYVNYERYIKGDKSNTVSTWASQNRKDFRIGKLKEDKYNLLVKINFPFESGYKKKG